jgi:hypothetical protein
MKIIPENPYYRAALALILMAAVLVITAALTNRGDFTSAALVIAALVCILTGILFAALSGPDPLDLRYMSLLPVQGTIGISKICADLGIQGTACFVHETREDQTRLVQFIPVADYQGLPLPGDSFSTDSAHPGLVTDPSCAPLLDLLKTRDHLTIPSEISALHNLIRETGVDVLEVAEKVQASHEGEVITVVMEDYLLSRGCRAAHAESPKCCSVNPCPVCSLFACLYAEGLGRAVKVESCMPSPKKKETVKAIFTTIHE